jgi:hypothetical protein
MNKEANGRWHSLPGEPKAGEELEPQKQGGVSRVGIVMAGLEEPSRQHRQAPHPLSQWQFQAQQGYAARNNEVAPSYTRMPVDVKGNVGPLGDAQSS